MTANWNPHGPYGPYGPHHAPPWAAVPPPPDRQPPPYPGAPYPPPPPSPAPRRAALFWTLGALVVVAAVLAGFLVGRATATDPTTSAASGLAAPELLTPASGSQFDYFPRTMTLVWQGVPGATSYTLDIQGQSDNSGGPVWFSHPGNGHQEGLTTTSVEFGFVGAQPGRWRVTAFGPDGAGPPSEWSTFEFLQ